MRNGVWQRRGFGLLSRAEVGTEVGTEVGAKVGAEVGVAVGVVAIGLSGAFVPAAFGQQTVQTLLYTEAGSPLGVIPNSGGVRISSFTQAQVGLSRLGTRWVIAINASGQPTTADTYVISGTAAGADWSFAEGTAMPGIGFAITGRPNAQLGVNESGDVAMKVTTNAPSNSNEMVVRANRAAGDFTLIAREGSPVPNIPTETHSGQFDSVTLFDDGRVAYRSGSTLGPLPSDQADFIFLGGDSHTTILQSGVFAPGNQFGGTEGLVIDFFDEAYVAADQTSHMVEVALAVPAANSRALMVNREVVLQSGAPIPGLVGDVPSSGFIDEARISPGGVWYAWGSSAAGTYYALVNGQLYVKEGDVFEDAPGETLLSIGYMSINARGDIAYSAALLTTATGQRRTVIVVDTVDAGPVIAVSTFRSGNVLEATQVDIDNDGVLDDAYCGFLTDDTVALADSGELYFVMRLVTSAGGTRSDGLFVLKDTPCRADFNRDGFLDFFDFDDFVACFETGVCPPGRTADFNLDGFVDFFDFDDFVAAFEAGC